MEVRVDAMVLVAVASPADLAVVDAMVAETDGKVRTNEGGDTDTGNDTKSKWWHVDSGNGAGNSNS